MNLALHGFLLQVILSILNFKHGFRLCSAGEPGYLDFDNLPETNFSCQGKVIGGYYADVEAGCQMFHVCTIGQKDEIMDIKFLCLNGTVFDQETRVCERVDEVDCSKSERFYNLNLELYGNNAVTLSLHEEEDDDDSTEPRDDRQQQQQQQQQHHMTSARPSTTSTTTTTTSRPSQPSTTSTSNSYQQHPTGYPQHYQPRPAFPSVQTSQSNTHYDDKNGGYHHQYIFHNDERSNNNQATSYQLFSNQGVSSTTPTPQVHQQVRYSSTASPQVIHNEPSTVTPLQFHVQSTSSTIQTLLNSNSNNPSIINPIFHNHGIASTTEHFNVHNNNPREIAEYQDDDEDERESREERRPLEPVQSTSKGKVSKLSISPVPQQQESQSVIQSKSSQSSQQQRISVNYLPTSSPIQTTISAFYPTQRPATHDKTQNNPQVSQHIHVPPPQSIPQLKPQQITINLPPPDIQRIVQNPSPLLPSQSRVIVTAKASVSDESGRPLNASQLITLPLPTIPSNYDEYKEGDESFDPFYRDVPKIRNDRRIVVSRKVEASQGTLRKKRSTEEEKDDGPSEEIIFNAEIKDIKDLKANLPIIKAILFGLPLPENEGSSYNTDTENVENTDPVNTEKGSYTGNEARKEVHDIDDTINTENISIRNTSEREYNEEDKIDKEIPSVVTHIPRTSRGRNRHAKLSTNQQRNEEPKIATDLFPSQLSPNPIIMKQDVVDIFPKDTVKLFLRAIESNNTLLSNGHITFKSEPLNSTSINSTEINNEDKKKNELLQTRSSSNGNRTSRRRYQNSESIEESAERIPRRNGRTNKPKVSRYHDDYDVSESIETSSRQRSNRIRQRPKDRRVTFKDDYVDEEVIEDEEYDEEPVSRNRKLPRRGPQGRKVQSRNRNRHYDYEDDLEEVDEKPRTRIKSSNTYNRGRGASQERSIEDNRRRLDHDRRRGGRKQNKSEAINSPIFEEADTKIVKDLNSPIAQNDKSVKYSARIVDANQPRLSSRKRLNSLERNDESIERLRDHSGEDYEQGELYSEEYSDSVEELPDDYIEYEDSKDDTSGRVNSQRHNNRFDEDIKPIPRRKSNRRDKSRKFVEVTVDKEFITEEKIEFEDIDTTTLPNEKGSITTNLPLEYGNFDEDINSQEYDDYNIANVTPNIESTANTELPINVKTVTEVVNTEGVFRFTDELPRAEKKDDVQEKKENPKETTHINTEDYVDDNYEPESYVEPKIKEPALSLSKSSEETNKHILTVNDQPKEIKTSNEEKSTTISNAKWDNKEDYSESYTDILESTTVSSVSEEYYDTDSTTDAITATTSAPTVTTSTGYPSTLSTTESTTMITTTSFTTPPSTSTTTSTTTTTTTTTTTPPPTTTPTTTTTARTKGTSKFIKPSRKNYAFIPPSTSPNPVVIRRGQPLSGPKPTKPPPSYNDLAPKPIIRRLPLLSRTTTTTSEATILEDKIAEVVYKHISKEANGNNEENYPTTSPKSSTSSFVDTVTPYAATKSTIRSRYNEGTTRSYDSTTVSTTYQTTLQDSITSTEKQETTTQVKEQSFDNEVPKQSAVSNESNNVPENAADSVAETTKSEAESTTYNQILSKLESTTIKADINIKTTTLKSLRPSERRKLELTSVKSQIQKGNVGPKRVVAGFNCLEKEMYRFYGDERDCRLFHYCSPGFTARQVLDFRFVCEEGTIFEEESQSCKHDVPNPKCVKRTW